MVSRRFRRTSAMGARARRVVRRRCVVARCPRPCLRLGAARLARAVRAVVESLHRPLLRALQPAVRRQRRRAPGRVADALCELARPRRNHRRSRCSVDERRPGGDQPRAGPRGCRIRADAARPASGVQARNARSAGRARRRPASGAGIDARSVAAGAGDGTDRSQRARPCRSGGSGQPRCAGARRAAGWLSRRRSSRRAGVAAGAAANDPAGRTAGAAATPLRRRACRARRHRPLLSRGRCPHPCRRYRHAVPPVAVPAPMPQPVAPALSQRGAPVRAGVPNSGPNDRPN